MKLTRDELLAYIERKDEYHTLKLKTSIGRYVRVSPSDLRAFLALPGADGYDYQCARICSQLAHHISVCIDPEPR